MIFCSLSLRLKNHVEAASYIITVNLELIYAESSGTMAWSSAPRAQCLFDLIINEIRLSGHVASPPIYSFMACFEYK